MYCLLSIYFNNQPLHVSSWLTAHHQEVKVKCSRYRPGVAQTVGRGIALLFHDRGTRRGWVVSSTPRPPFTPGKDPVSILQEAGWTPGPVCTGGKSRLHRDSIPDCPARSQALNRLSYPAHTSSGGTTLYIQQLVCHAFIMTGCWQDRNGSCQQPVNTNAWHNTNCCICRVVPPDDEQ